MTCNLATTIEPDDALCHGFVKNSLIEHMLGVSCWEYQQVFEIKETLKTADLLLRINLCL